MSVHNENMLMEAAKYVLLGAEWSNPEGSKFTCLKKKSKRVHTELMDVAPAMYYS